MKTTHKFCFLKYVLCLLFVQSTLQTLAQTTKPVVAAKTKRVVAKNGLGVWQQFRNDTVRLRWIPVEATQWILNNQRGYFVERGEVVKGQKVVFKKLTERPILPARKDAKTQSEEEYVGLKSIHEEGIQTSLDDKLGEDVANQLLLRHLVGTMTAFKSFRAAQKMGLGFIDVSVQKGKQYAYRVFPNQIRTKGEPPIDTTYILVNTNKNSTTKQPPMLSKEELEKSVFLTWPARNYLKEFILYHVEKSEDGTNFKRVSTSPIMYSDSKSKVAHFKDSLTQNYRPYLYRLVGMTPFGEWITSQMPIMAMGRDKTPPAQPIIESAKHIGGSKVEIRWKMPVNEGDLKGFWIGRASGVSSKYNKITALLSQNTTKITDLRADLTGTNHYMVYAVDTSGNERASFPTYVALTDSLPPAAPKGLVAKAIADKANKTGVVTITWKNNKEKDLQGYYVYFANDPDHEFSQITKQMLADTIFRDTITLRSLTKNVFYKVVAMDKHFNISDFSAVAIAQRPDIIPPVVPLITDLTVKDSTATVVWQRSPSNDVVEYRLYRREQGKEWVKMKTFRGAQLSTRQFEDANLKTGIRYEYSLDVMDESGLISDRSPLRVARALPPLFLPNPPEPEVTYIDESKENQLTWNYAATGKYKIAIYRADNQKGYQLLGFAYPKDSQYLDKPRQAGRYKYMMRAIHDNGKQTQWSKEVTIQTN